MDALLLWLGRAAGFGGALICAIAVLFRLSGGYFLGGFQVGTLLLAGAVTMLFGCVCLLAWLTRSKA